MKRWAGYAVMLLLGAGCLFVGCKKGGGEDARGAGPREGGGGAAKLAELYKRRADISDGWLKVLEENANKPDQGALKAREYVDANLGEMVKMAKDVCVIIRAGQKDAAIRTAFEQINADVKVKMVAWKERAGAVNAKYPGKASDLSGQYTELSAAFFATAKICLPN